MDDAGDFGGDPHGEVEGSLGEEAGDEQGFENGPGFQKEAQCFRFLLDEEEIGKEELHGATYYLRHISF